MSKEINLEINGRMFPSWILENFKRFKLKPIIRDPNEDPCKIKGNNKKELHLYQKFLGTYLTYNSPFKDILIYHGYGAGKTVSAINIYNVLFNYTPKWNVFILIKASLKDDPWLKDLKAWISEDNNKARWNNIYFVHYDSPIADRTFLETIKNVDSSKNTMYIIDEAHNFIRNVYNNISTKKGKRAQVIYDYIQQEKIENNNTRIVMITADPAVNNPYELALIFNLMRPETFPDNEAYFNQIYISSTNFASLNRITKNMFQRRILGLVSYYIGATPDKYARKVINYKNIIMPPKFEEVYNFYEEIEDKMEKIRRKFNRGKVGNNTSSYASYTRQSCNFVFPDISEKVNGETRPRPGKFRVSNEEALKLDEAKNKEKIKDLVKNNDVMKKYAEALNDFISVTVDYFKTFMRKDKEKKYTLQEDVKVYFNKYKGKFSDFYENEKKKSTLFNILYQCSPKMIMSIFYILKSPGSVLFYSNFVKAEGLQLFKIYLQFFGFIYLPNDENFSEKKLNTNQKKDFFRFVEFHGGIDTKIRLKNKNLFNNPENKKGKIAKIILISPAGSEGINLKNVRQVHILEPFWNEVRIEQMIGRAIRQCSHADLPMDQRNVTVYRFKMIRKNKKETSDEKMEDISRRKNNLIQSFLEAIREVAVDCELFKSHNMMATEYKCFKFTENSLLKKPIGPAYTKKIDFDIRLNEGSNTSESNRIKVKVRKIKAIKRIDDKTFSEEFFCWIYDKTGIVYDLDLHYPIGRVKFDEQGNLEKIDSKTYIISDPVEIIKNKIFQIEN